MTNYFGVQLVGTQYTVNQFWISFAVILGVSWAVLFVTGVFSGRVETIEAFAALVTATKAMSHWFRKRMARK